MTTEPPTVPPTSGPAVELPPASGARPTVTVYPYPHPLLWIFWPDRWQAATVRARQNWPTGAVAYQVELAMFDQDGYPSRVSRTFLWGPDSIRKADEPAP